jgi:hypothetical protein
MKKCRLTHCPLEAPLKCPYKTRVSRKRRSSSITRSKLILDTPSTGHSFPPHYTKNNAEICSRNRPVHRISIPAYAIEQQWWQLGVSKNDMSLIFKMMLVLYQSGLITGVITNIYWHASKWSSISFSHSQSPSDREFSFPRFVGY